MHIIVCKVYYLDKNAQMKTYQEGRKEGRKEGSFPKIFVPFQFVSLISPSSHLILLSATETSKANASLRI